MLKIDPMGPGESFFAVLRVCVVTSFLSLVAATIMRLPPVVAMLGGAGPLVYYHLFYLTPRAKRGLSHAAIDSVYYFGFLVTIAALGVSAVSLAVSGGKEPLSNVAFQFGLGLIATGYAVLARMHLTSVTTLVDEASPEAVLDRYIQRSRELVTNVEMASTQFVELANNLMLKSKQVADTAQVSAEKSMLQVASRFDEELRTTLASATQGLTEVRGMVSDIGFAKEREELVRGMKLTLDCVAHLNKALLEFAQRSSESARSSALVASSSSAANDRLVVLSENLDQIAGKDGKLLATAESISQAQGLLAQNATILNSTLKELNKVSKIVGNAGTALENVKTLSEQANERLVALNESTEQLESAARNITKTAVSTNALATSLDRTVAAVPLLGERVLLLEGQFARLGNVVENVLAQVQTLPAPTQQVVTLSTELKEALASVRQVLVEAGTEANSLATHSATSVEALKEAHKFAGDVAALQAGTQSVERLLESLSSSITRLHQDLTSSTGTLKLAISAAAGSLETDVTRSSQAARMFSERLSGVAQVIIDNTKAVRTS